MTHYKCKIKKQRVALIFWIFLCVVFINGVKTSRAEKPKKIVISEIKESILKRMERTITLDVRDMNMVDILKFLALKGEFNIVISPAVQGRTTVLLNNVSIRNALDIVIISNHLAYEVEGNIVQIMTSAE